MIKIEEPAEFFAENDYYLIKGKKYWRVTRVKSVINQPTLNLWRARIGVKEATKIMKERQALGSKMHKLFELKLLGEDINPDNYKNEEIKIDLGLFDTFLVDCEIEAESVEQHLWSNEYGIAGTADYLGSYKSNIKYLKRNAEAKFTEKSFVVGDWKSSSGIYKDYWIQLAAYVKMVEDMTGIKPDGAFIAQFRNGKVKVEEQTYEELMKYFGVMKHCIEIFKYTKGE